MVLVETKGVVQGESGRHTEAERQGDDRPPPFKEDDRAR